MKLNGKLARIQEQEKLLLAKVHSNKKIFSDAVVPTSDSFTNFNEEMEIKTKKKRKHNEESSNIISDGDQDSKFSKVKQKKENIKEKDVVNFENNLEMNASKKKKKHKRKNKSECTELENKESKYEFLCNSDFLNDERENDKDKILELAEIGNSEEKTTRHKKKKKRKNRTSDLAENR